MQSYFVISPTDNTVCPGFAGSDVNQDEIERNYKVQHLGTCLKDGGIKCQGREQSAGRQQTNGKVQQQQGPNKAYSSAEQPRRMRRRRRNGTRRRAKYGKRLRRRHTKDRITYLRELTRSDSSRPSTAPRPKLLKSIV